MHRVVELFLSVSITIVNKPRKLPLMRVCKLESFSKKIAIYVFVSSNPLHINNSLNSKLLTVLINCSDMFNENHLTSRPLTHKAAYPWVLSYMSPT